MCSCFRRISTLNDDRDDVAIDTLNSNLDVKKVGVVEYGRLCTWVGVFTRSIASKWIREPTYGSVVNSYLMSALSACESAAMIVQAV